MRLVKVYSTGTIHNKSLYAQLQEVELNNPNFINCGNEFKENRDWWVYVDAKGVIVAYCGCLYSEGVCIFNRAWVKKQYRGKGLHKKMIRLRINAAKKRAKVAITYTIFSNFASANNLISLGFKLYDPAYRYGGDVLYFIKYL